MRHKGTLQLIQQRDEAFELLAKVYGTVRNQLRTGQPVQQQRDSIAAFIIEVGLEVRPLLEMAQQEYDVEPDPDPYEGLEERAAYIRKVMDKR